MLGLAAGLLGEDATSFGDAGQADLAGVGIEAEAGGDGWCSRHQQRELLGGVEATCGHGSMMPRGCDRVSRDPRVGWRTDPELLVDVSRGRASA